MLKQCAVCRDKHPSVLLRGTCERKCLAIATVSKIGMNLQAQSKSSKPRSTKYLTTHERAWLSLVFALLLLLPLLAPSLDLQGELSPVLFFPIAFRLCVVWSQQDTSSTPRDRRPS